MGGVRKPRVEGAEPQVEPKVAKPADPVPGDNGAALSRIAEYFRKKHPDDWEELRLQPLQHGIQSMAERLKD